MLALVFLLSHTGLVSGVQEPQTIRSLNSGPDYGCVTLYFEGSSFKNAALSSTASLF